MGKQLRRKGGRGKKKRYDAVEHPCHYVGRVPGVECITVASRFDFCLGNVVKYVWRAGRKGGPDKELEDLRKAEFYLRYRIRALQQEQEQGEKKRRARGARNAYRGLLPKGGRGTGKEEGGGPWAGR